MACQHNRYAPIRGASSRSRRLLEATGSASRQQMRQVRASDRDETCAASNVHGEALSAIKADAHEEMTLSLSAALVARMCSLSEAR